MLQVMFTDVAREQLHKAHQQKAAQGQSAQLLRVLESLAQRLSGEPLPPSVHLFKLPGSGLPVIETLVSPLVVHYAVDETRGIAYVHHIRLVA